MFDKIYALPYGTQVLCYSHTKKTNNMFFLLVYVKRFSYCVTLTKNKENKGKKRKHDECKKGH